MINLIGKKNFDFESEIEDALIRARAYRAEGKTEDAKRYETLACNLSEKYKLLETLKAEKTNEITCFNKTLKFNLEKNDELIYKNGSIDVFYYQQGVNTVYDDTGFSFALVFYDEDGEYICEFNDFYFLNEKEVIEKIKDVLKITTINGYIVSRECFRFLKDFAFEYLEHRKGFVNDK